MKKLLKLETAIHPGVKDLRKLHGTVKSHVRPLKVFGINHQNFSPLSTVILQRGLLFDNTFLYFNNIYLSRTLRDNYASLTISTLLCCSFRS